jgi:4'-phosphopantetheinyl transferase
MIDEAVTPSTVHLWHARFDWLADKYNTFESSLAADERLRAARYIAQQMRDRYVLARGMLRAVLASYVNAIPGALRLAYGLRGKPFLPNSDLRFNLSHADGLIVLAVSQGAEIGVDVERVRPIPEMKTMVRDNFSLREQAALWSLPAVDQPDAFFRIWTRKEAYVKALGDGYMSFGQFEVNHENPPRITWAEHGDPSRWALAHLDLGAEYAGALCVEGGTTPQVITRNFLELPA